MGTLSNQLRDVNPKIPGFGTPGPILPPDFKVLASLQAPQGYKLQVLTSTNSGPQWRDVTTTSRAGATRDAWVKGTKLTLRVLNTRTQATATFANNFRWGSGTGQTSIDGTWRVNVNTNGVAELIPFLPARLHAPPGYKLQVLTSTARGPQWRDVRTKPQPGEPVDSWAKNTQLTLRVLNTRTKATATFAKNFRWGSGTGQTSIQGTWRVNLHAYGVAQLTHYQTAPGELKAQTPVAPPNHVIEYQTTPGPRWHVLTNASRWPKGQPVRWRVRQLRPSAVKVTFPAGAAWGTPTTLSAKAAAGQQTGWQLSFAADGQVTARPPQVTIWSKSKSDSHPNKTGWDNLRRDLIANIKEGGENAVNTLLGGIKRGADITQAQAEHMASAALAFEKTLARNSAHFALVITSLAAIEGLSSLAKGCLKEIQQEGVTPETLGLIVSALQQSAKAAAALLNTFALVRRFSQLVSPDPKVKRLANQELGPLLSQMQALAQELKGGARSPAPLPPGPSTVTNSVARRLSQSPAVVDTLRIDAGLDANFVLPAELSAEFGSVRVFVSGKQDTATGKWTFTMTLREIDATGFSFEGLDAGPIQLRDFSLNFNEKTKEVTGPLTYTDLWAAGAQFQPEFFGFPQQKAKFKEALTNIRNGSAGTYAQKQLTNWAQRMGPATPVGQLLGRLASGVKAGAAAARAGAQALDGPVETAIAQWGKYAAGKGEVGFGGGGFVRRKLGEDPNFWTGVVTSLVFGAVAGVAAAAITLYATRFKKKQLAFGVAHAAEQASSFLIDLLIQQTQGDARGTSSGGVFVGWAAWLPAAKLKPIRKSGWLGGGSGRLQLSWARTWAFERAKPGQKPAPAPAPRPAPAPVPTPRPTPGPPPVVLPQNSFLVYASTDGTNYQMVTPSTRWARGTRLKFQLRKNVPPYRNAVATFPPVPWGTDSSTLEFANGRHKLRVTANGEIRMDSATETSAARLPRNAALWYRIPSRTQDWARLDDKTPIENWTTVQFQTRRSTGRPLSTFGPVQWGRGKEELTAPNTGSKLSLEPTYENGKTSAVEIFINGTGPDLKPTVNNNRSLAWRVVWSRNPNTGWNTIDPDTAWPQGTKLYFSLQRATDKRVYINTEPVTWGRETKSFVFGMGRLTVNQSGGIQLS